MTRPVGVVGLVGKGTEPARVRAEEMEERAKGEVGEMVKMEKTHNHIQKENSLQSSTHGLMPPVQ